MDAFVFLGHDGHLTLPKYVHFALPKIVDSKLPITAFVLNQAETGLNV